MSKLTMQRAATRLPEDGQSHLREYAFLEYEYDHSGAALKLPLAASAEEPILLLEVSHVVLTAFTGGTPAIDIGDGSDADCYLDATDVTEGTAGNFVQSRDGASADAVKKTGEYLTAARQITVTLSASLSAGKGLVIAEFIRL